MKKRAMKEHRLTRVLIVAALVVTLVPLTGVAALAAGTGQSREAGAEPGAAPDYRTFIESDLKNMPYKGGWYSCLKASPPYTFFRQDWYGTSLEYLLDVEVGMKPGTTGVKFIAEDGYSITLTPAEVRMVNPENLVTILAYKKGEPDKKGSALTELDREEGPFRLMVPQKVIGPHGEGTDNFNRSVRMLRAIEVQPIAPGTPKLVPAKMPKGQLTVYGNIQNRRTFTVGMMKAMKSYSGTYKWRNSIGTEGSSKLVGSPLPFFLEQTVGLIDGSDKMTAKGADGYSKDFTLEDATKTYPDGNQMLIAWSEDGKDLDPSDKGPLRLIRPQTSATDVNTGDWIRQLRVIGVNPTSDNGPGGASVPADRLIVYGNIDPANVPGTWYLAEGYTGDGFEEWICIGNPNPWVTVVQITYMVEGEGTKTREVSVDPMSRTTVNAADTVGAGKNVSATVASVKGDGIVVERAMYWGGRVGGHCAAGVTAAATEWYLAEGCTAGGFETWVLVQNPGDAPAIVKLTYNTATGPVAGPTLNMPANSRTTINVADKLADNWEVSTQVEADVPIIAERAMYWAGRQAGHDATGVNSPSTEWYMAEGCTADGFETWVLVQNPGDQPANVAVTYMNAQGTQAGPTFTLAAHSRKTINVADVLKDDFQVSTKVTSDRPVIAGRSIYWNNRSGGTCENAVGQPKIKSLLAEGATDGGFESWILVQNPGAADATVFITYLTGEGPVERAALVVKAGTRVSVNEFDDVGANMQVSAQIMSNLPVTVERAVYWNNRVEGTCSKGLLSW